MVNYFSYNLENLMVINNLSQRALAESLGISNTAVSKYLKGENEPSSSILLELKDKYKINIDDFLTKKLDISTFKEVLSSNINFGNSYVDRFMGNFLLYYYNTGFYKGKVDALTYNTLAFGVLSIFKDSRHNIAVRMLPFKSRTDAENFKLKLDNLSDAEIETEFNGGDVYRGSLDFNFTQIYIDIKNDRLNDRAFIVLNNPPTESNYIGGLGTVNSVSRSRELMPCVQLVIVSKYVLSKSTGELYSLLSLGSSEINVKKETEQIIRLFKNLYINTENGEDMFLEEYQKVKIIENCVENLMRELIDANVFRYAKVSNSEDDDFYRLIKSEMHK